MISRWYTCLICSFTCPELTHGATPNRWLSLSLRYSLGISNQQYCYWLKKSADIYSIATINYWVPYINLFIFLWEISTCWTGGISVEYINMQKDRGSLCSQLISSCPHIFLYTTALWVSIYHTHVFIIEQTICFTPGKHENKALAVVMNGMHALQFEGCHCVCSVMYRCWLDWNLHNLNG